MLMGPVIQPRFHLCHIGCKDVLLSVNEKSSLLLDGLHHSRVAVPCRLHSDSCVQIVLEASAHGEVGERTIHAVTGKMAQRQRPHLPPCRDASVHLWCICMCPQPSQR